MKPTKPDSVRLVKCEKCGVLVADHRLSKHIRKVHSRGAEALRASDLAAQKQAAIQQKSLLQVIACPLCKKQIKLSEAKSHFGNAHSKPAPAELLNLMGDSAPKNLFKSAREREAYWRELDGVSYAESRDLFDRTKVLSGGAYGLGKSRKH